MDSTSVSSQDTSSIEIEFVSESEGQLENANLLPTNVFSKQHDNELFQEIDATSDNGSLPELCITFHLHYISFALHLRNLPHQHEMHATS